MGLRFRKSFKVAPGVKVNLNKKSASVTLGGKGVHKTISTTGKSTTSVGVPGTGMYYTSSSGGSSNKQTEVKQDNKISDNTNEDIFQQAPTLDASLEKFSSESLHRYKMIFLVISIIAYFSAALCFFNTTFSFGLFFLLLGLFSTGMSKTYANEISNRLLLFNSDSDEFSNVSGFSSGTGKKPKKKGHGCLTGIIVFVLIIILAESCSTSDKSDDSKENTSTNKVIAVETITLSADTETVYDINTEIPIEMTVKPEDGEIADLICKNSGGTFTNQDGQLVFSSDAAGTYELSVSCGEIKSNSLTITIEDKAAIAAAEAQKQAEEEAAAQAAAQAEQERIAAEQQAAQQPQTSSYVVNTSTKKFHSPSCKDVSKIKQANYWAYEGTREDLINQGYSPCGHCKP